MKGGGGEQDFLLSFSFGLLTYSPTDLGYRHIDTAIFYQNHKLIGQALTEIFKEGKYKREDIFITTKIMPLAQFN